MNDLSVTLRNALRAALRNLDDDDADLWTIAEAVRQSAKLVVDELDKNDNQEGWES